MDQHLILAYPTLQKADWDWIQRIRAIHDQRNYQIVDPHFTLVFPVPAAHGSAFIDHIRRQSKGTARIQFKLRCALVVKDPMSQYTQTYLVPEEGFSAIVQLHDRLYTEILEPHLRLEIPYIPHITAGISNDPWICKQLADEINQQNLEIPGRIDSLDVVQVEKSIVRTTAKVALF